MVEFDDIDTNVDDEDFGDDFSTDTTDSGDSVGASTDEEEADVVNDTSSRSRDDDDDDDRDSGPTREEDLAQEDDLFDDGSTGTDTTDTPTDGQETTTDDSRSDEERARDIEPGVVDDSNDSGSDGPTEEEDLAQEDGLFDDEPTQPSGESDEERARDIEPGVFDSDASRDDSIGPDPTDELSREEANEIEPGVEPAGDPRIQFESTDPTNEVTVSVDREDRGGIEMKWQLRTAAAEQFGGRQEEYTVDFEGDTAVIRGDPIQESQEESLVATARDRAATVFGVDPADVTVDRTDAGIVTGVRDEAVPAAQQALEDRLGRDVTEEDLTGLFEENLQDVESERVTEEADLAREFERTQQLIRERSDQQASRQELEDELLTEIDSQTPIDIGRDDVQFEERTVGDQQQLEAELTPGASREIARLEAAEQFDSQTPNTQIEPEDIVLEPTEDGGYTATLSDDAQRELADTRQELTREQEFLQGIPLLGSAIDRAESGAEVVTREARDLIGTIQETREEQREFMEENNVLTGPALTVEGVPLVGGPTSARGAIGSRTTTRLVEELTAFAGISALSQELKGNTVFPAWEGAVEPGTFGATAVVGARGFARGSGFGGLPGGAAGAGAAVLAQSVEVPSPVTDEELETPDDREPVTGSEISVPEQPARGERSVPSEVDAPESREPVMDSEVGVSDRPATGEGSFDPEIGAPEEPVSDTPGDFPVISAAQLQRQKERQRNPVRDELDRFQERMRRRRQRERRIREQQEDRRERILERRRERMEEAESPVLDEEFGVRERDQTEERELETPAEQREALEDVFQESGPAASPVERVRSAQQPLVEQRQDQLSELMLEQSLSQRLDLETNLMQLQRPVLDQRSRLDQIGLQLETPFQDLTTNLNTNLELTQRVREETTNLRRTTRTRRRRSGRQVFPEFPDPDTGETTRDREASPTETTGTSVLGPGFVGSTFEDIAQGIAFNEEEATQEELEEFAEDNPDAFLLGELPTGAELDDPEEFEDLRRLLS